MKLYLPSFGLVMLYLSPAFGAEMVTVTLTPTALKAIAIAGDAGAPTFTTQNVSTTYEVRARDFATGAVRNNVVYHRFDLSSLGKMVIQTASLKFNRVAGDTLSTGRFALYGLQELPANIAQHWTASTFAYGAEFDPAMYADAVASTGACPVNLANVVDFSQQEAVSGSVATLNSADFISFLQARADAGGQATVLLGMPSQGAGNDKKMTFAYPGHADATLPVSLVLAYSAVPLPSPPASFSLADISYSVTPSLTVDWEPVDGALAYNVYRRKVGESTATLVATTEDPSYFDDAVTLFGTYYYSVDVTTENGQSVPSIEFEVRVIDAALGTPISPDGARTTATLPGGISLAWNPVPNAFSYELYRATEADGAYSLLQSVDTAAATDEADVKNYRSYYYRVKAISAGGISKYSETLTVAPRFTRGRHPARPRNISTASGTTYSVDLTWDASADALAYYVYRSAGANSDRSLVGITEGTSFTDSFAVYPQNSYDYTVVAVGASGFSRPSEALEVDALLANYKQAEKLNRSPVAVPTTEGVFLSWRLLGTDQSDTGFYVYRDGRRLNHHPLRGATNFLDPEGDVNSTYEVRSTVGLFELSGHETSTMLANGYLSIPIQAPPAGVTPDGVAYSYAANDATTADLDGDGAYEIVLKWDPSNSQDNANNGYTGNVFIDAYKLDGSLLWRVDLGKNVRAGAHYSPFLVYDFNGDGRGEMIVRTADGSVDGQGVVIGDAAVDYRSSVGRILEGPEFLSLFDGETGAALDTIDYVPARGNVVDWGDNYGNRSDRFNAGVAYLDGTRPSAFFARGYYRGQSGMGAGITAVAAYRVQDEQLVTEWVFDTRIAGDSYIGQGNHQVASGDLNGDGKDEIALGSLVLGSDGSVLYSTNLGHGDAMHVSDLDPTRPGLEMFSVKEEAGQPYQDVFSDAATGAVIWGAFNGKDTGRGIAADIDPNYAGVESWGAANASVWSAKGDVLGQKRPSMNFAIWWDGDPLRELLDNTTVRKWDFANEKEVVLLETADTASNNGTKATPCLQADLLGDWREEVILRSADNSELRIYTTSSITEHRIPTLMHDAHYRVAVAAQNSGYNQPPQTSFFIGNNMPSVAMPKVFVSPIPEFLGTRRHGREFDSAALVVLNVNQGEALVNEYSIDGAPFKTYRGPFVVIHRGTHAVTFRTLDSNGVVLAEASRSLTIGHHGRGDHWRWGLDERQAFGKNGSSFEHDR